MATSKRSASPSRPGTTSTARSGRPPEPARRSARQPPPVAGALSLASLLMVGADRVIIDEQEDDNLHFMAEYIDPA
jgi:hypothetical protein